VIAIACIIALSGCDRRGSGGASEDPPAGSVLVLAASSTKDAVEEIGREFKIRTGIEVLVSPGASNVLAGQVLAGSPGDVFLSASAEWARRVSETDCGQEIKPLLGNSLVLVVPTDNPSEVRTPDDLAGPSSRRVAIAGEKVPAGVYAEQALRATGLLERLVAEDRIVRGQDVRVVLSYVETGEVDAGIVYATDARLSRKVGVVYRFNAGTHEPIVYPVVLLKSGNPAGRKFYEYLASAEAMAIFERHGFTKPPDALR
jgi:molybdate transport system substrate-binding protein